MFWEIALHAVILGLTLVVSAVRRLTTKTQVLVSHTNLLYNRPGVRGGYREASRLCHGSGNSDCRDILVRLGYLVAP